MSDKPMHNNIFKNLLLGRRWMNYEIFLPLKLRFGIGTNQVKIWNWHKAS